jgi:Ran GTPase-activating protein (RanGAP) involved in mRNA processing and transport
MKLLSLVIHEVELTVDFVANLAVILSNAPMLISLDLSRCKLALDDAQVCTLVASVASQKRSCEYVSNEQPFADMLSGARQLRELKLHQVVLGEKHGVAVTRALKDLHALVALDLRHCRLKDVVSTNLCVLIGSTRCSLDTLRLSGNSIKDEGLRMLLAAMKLSGRPQSVDLGQTKVTASGVSKLLDLYQSSNRITSLHLSKIELNARIVERLSSILTSSPCLLMRLVLEGVGLGRSGCLTLLAALAKNKSIVELNLGDNGLDQKCASAVSDVLRQHPSLTVLELSRSSLSGPGMAAIAQCLREGAHLQSLGLGYCQLTVRAASCSDRTGDLPPWRVSVSVSVCLCVCECVCDSVCVCV